ncbi:pyridoxamine 5'-phosphate oxidase 1 [Uncinocarpus reesii 1704]|uniref:pyridoxal 5'-phosphate synthase n=1 Tax=Uncinocarpus reesii (strain UAMH 1704) TaxID=336963 RepID=C4JDD4_UNCRE|nr:pyridoxamine 5'-phosphate oxidase 1 [Uncinocarpus reesii 1704]EEP75847.1 pyridoxamine 5'-phosphate oxidase 1 [Uncinocarpus reesii 1704]
MTLDNSQSPGEHLGHEHRDSHTQPHRHPKRLIFAPGDIQAPLSSPAAPSTATPRIVDASTNNTDSQPTVLRSSLLPTLDDPTLSGASTPSTNAAVVSHAARAHQFLTNPPLTLSQIHPTNPLHQFHTWFRDARLPASSAPETCTLATASMPSGRVSARVVYLKELDERGWVVYSNWGSRAGKGGQVFGTATEAETGVDGSVIPDDGQGRLEGNRWAALTFNWPRVERQVRVEGLIEMLSREESETYWRVRERGSQIGAWASQQSKVLWSTEPQDLTGVDAAPGAGGDGHREDVDDGRSVLENRVKEMEERFAGAEEIPLPPFWGGVRLVPESVEFWQGRKSRLHDRFRYVRVNDEDEQPGVGDEKTFRWRIQRLSP